MCILLGIFVWRLHFSHADSAQRWQTTERGAHGPREGEGKRDRESHLKCLLYHGSEKTASLDLAVILGHTSVNNTSIGHPDFSLWFSQFKYTFSKKQLSSSWPLTITNNAVERFEWKGPFSPNESPPPGKFLENGRGARRLKTKKCCPTFWKGKEAYLRKYKLTINLMLTPRKMS